MTKISQLAGKEWVDYPPRSVFVVEDGRIFGQVAGGDVRVFAGLAASLAAPVMLLYVLHTPRGEAAAGRYQSSPLDMPALQAFLAGFASFLSADARFDIWVHSPGDAATVVWDRHNHLFAYGPLDRHAAELEALGCEQGPLASLGVHRHYYREACDPLARALIDAFDWTYSPLRPEDEQ